MIIYYVEVNLVCIIILLLFRMQLKNRDNNSSEQRMLIYMIGATILFCVSDMFAGIFRGKMFAGARAVIEISNFLYFEAIAVVSFLWAVYVQIRITKNHMMERKLLFAGAVPLITFTVIAMSNPVTHILFRISEDNLYERNVGVYLHWILIWSYFLIPSVRVLRAYMQERSSLRRQEIRPLVLFMVAPFIASTIQMIFYGVTTTQVGITVSIVMICLKSQDAQILTDALTGINNRRGMEYFIANQMQRNEEAEYTMIMIDVDHFKMINDKYGHMAGDLVLKQIAEVLKNACKVVSNRMHLSRFGGDEFVILGVDCHEDDVRLLHQAIDDEMKKEAEEHKLPCAISVSIGSAAKRCSSEEEFRELINLSDQAMYEKKIKR